MQPALLVVLLVLYTITDSGASQTCRCRCLPTSQCWPNAETWNAFNVSLGGHLLKPLPPAAPCHALDFSDVACDSAIGNWSNPFWRSDRAGAMQHPNTEADGDAVCKLPSSHQYAYTACYQGSVPAFTVQVSEASQVQTAVAFATKHNLRLTIKSTGHDLMGRSTAPASLNIWMHHLKNITFHDSFSPERCSNDVNQLGAVTAGAGVQWNELYEAVDRKGKVVVGAMGSSVSTGGGYLQGGGHSPLSPLLGLAADNVVEMKVVTADGRLRTANSCQNQDLFWALRGGGGGTFGVVISATHRTYPALNIVLRIQVTAQARSLSAFQRLVTKFVELQSSLSESDSWAGYSYFKLTSIVAEYLLPRVNHDAGAHEAAIAAFEPITAYVNQHSDEMNISLVVHTFPSFLSWYKYVMCSMNPDVCANPTGSHMALASWLLPKELVRNDAREVAKAFVEILGKGVDQIIGHLVGGGAVASTNQNTSVNPGWRKALWHVILMSAWTSDEACATIETGQMRFLTQANGLLQELAPDSGCYLNEADFNEPRWPTAFFGRNYEQLRRIKKQVDPQALFTCKNCVGSQDSMSGFC